MKCFGCFMLVSAMLAPQNRRFDLSFCRDVQGHDHKGRPSATFGVPYDDDPSRVTVII